METDREKDLAKIIGAAIAKRRESAALSQEILAELLGIGVEAVSRMERGVTMPGITRLLDLADALSCPVQELIAVSSDRSTEHGIRLASKLEKMKPADRELVLQIVDRLASRLAAS